MAFRVPEASRLPIAASVPGTNDGYFKVPSPEPGWQLFLICSDGLGWRHVSARAIDPRGRSRTPTWREMAFLKDLCWEPDDVVMQLHPARAQYVNLHPHVLHLWQPVEGAIPVPPLELV